MRTDLTDNDEYIIDEIRRGLYHHEDVTPYIEILITRFKSIYAELARRIEENAD